MEKIPSILEYQKKNEMLKEEIPQLQEIAGKVRKKEELKQPKSKLATLDRKIHLELAPPVLR